MRRRRHPHLALAGALLTLLALTGSASAAPELQVASGVRRVTLSPAGVRELIDGGVRVQVSTSEVGVHPAEVRLFVYERALTRGGQPGKPPIPASWRMFVSPLAHLHFTQPNTTQYVTLHVDPVYRASLLRAGSIILGVVADGY